MEKFKRKKEIVLSLIISIFAIFLSLILFEDFLLSIYVLALIFLTWFVYFFSGAEILSPLILYFVMFLFFIAIGPIEYYIRGLSLNYNICLIIIISLIFLLMGYFIGKLMRRRITNKLWRIWSLNYNNDNCVTFICTFIIIISLILKAYYLYSNRFILFGQGIESGRVEAASGNGLVNLCSNLWSPAACILYELKLEGKKIKKYNYVLIIIAIAFGLFSGFRTGVLAFILTILIMYNKKKRIPSFYIIIAGIMMVLFIFFYGVFREGGKLLYSFTNSARLLGYALTQQAYTGIINIGYIMDAFPRKNSFMLGYGYLINIIMLKPGHDLDFTLTLKNILGLNFSGGGVTPTILGEFYLNFGLVGIFIGMFICGMILLKLEKSYKADKFYYIPAFLIVEFLLSIRTGFANVEITVLTNCIIYLFVCFCSRKISIQ